jgi:hypothetical protein
VQVTVPVSVPLAATLSFPVTVPASVPTMSTVDLPAVVSTLVGGACCELGLLASICTAISHADQLDL